VGMGVKVDERHNFGKKLKVKRRRPKNES
jgi:hypothetical protein